MTRAALTALPAGLGQLDNLSRLCIDQCWPGNQYRPAHHPGLAGLAYLQRLQDREGLVALLADLRVDTDHGLAVEKSWLASMAPGGIPW